MANGYVGVSRIEARQHGPGTPFQFAAIVSDPQGIEHVVPVTAAELLGYATFQEAVLTRSALLFRHLGCEGRDSLAADEAWRSAITPFIVRVAPAPATPEAVN
jgi:hypothetical protein